MQKGEKIKRKAAHLFKAMRRWLLMTVWFLPLASSAQHSIAGNNAVCPGQVETYSVTGQPVPVSYQWSVAGGNILSISSGTVTVAWGGAGSGNVSVVLFDAGGIPVGNPSLTVNIASMPNPVLITHFDNECVI